MTQSLDFCRVRGNVSRRHPSMPSGSRPLWPVSLFLPTALRRLIEAFVLQVDPNKNAGRNEWCVDVRVGAH